MGTVINHGFDEPSDDMNPGPVSTMHNDVAFTFVLGKLFCKVIFDVAFSDGRYFGRKGFLIGIFDVNRMVLFNHEPKSERYFIILALNAF